MYTSRLREGLETHLASIASIVSDTTDHCCLIRECLETHLYSNHQQDLGTQTRIHQRHSLGSHPVTTMSHFFTNTSNIFEVTSSFIKTPSTSYLLWRGNCWHMGIKNFISATYSLCKYTWEVVSCMVLTGKWHLGPDIWPKTLKQAENIKSMMSTTCCIMKNIYYQKIHSWYSYIFFNTE